MMTFGPVSSRRLGKSLGINNIVSPKVCSYNCVYCQAGQTSKISSIRSEFYKPEVIYECVARHLGQLSRDNYPDYLTFVSNGEPTLDKNLGKSIARLKSFRIPLAVISNASMLNHGEVRNDLMQADWVSLKMDAGDGERWHNINRPATNLDFDIIINGIMKFARDYEGVLCTETMLISGINDSSDNSENLSGLISEINPHTAYLAIPIRPPSEISVKPPDSEKLNLAWQIFSDRMIKTELLVGFEGTNTGYTGNIYDDILNITAVHPLRDDSMDELLKNDHADKQVIESLIEQGLIRSVPYNGHRYYMREYHIENN